MKLRIKIVSYLLLLIYSYSYGQIDQYHHKRELKKISNQWHKIILSDDILGKISQDLADIRIFGITTNKDTVEVPYLLHLSEKRIFNKTISFKTLNISHNDKGYFFTFEIPTKEPINQINLKFKQKNFDWRLNLEGGQNQQEWFSIIENYRILSIKNELTNFEFSRITFPTSKYRFFRLFISSKENPTLSSAEISQHKTRTEVLKSYPITEIKTKELQQSKQTEINVNLQMPVPVSYIKIGIADTIDYYRTCIIKYLSDSFKTERGWKYNYSTLTSGTLNSFEANEFRINSTLIQKLKIIINNQDNQPLTIDKIQINGYMHELIARFTKPATYFLVYGNKNAGKPEYDIAWFMEKVPSTLTTLELGEEQAINKNEPLRTPPLFRNKAWLWAIIVLIILLLGWFSINMIRKK